MEQEPIEQLREQGKVTEKFASLESALNSVRENLSAASSPQGMNNTGPHVCMRENLRKEEQTYARLFRALEDMKARGCYRDCSTWPLMFVTFSILMTTAEPLRSGSFSSSAGTVRAIT